MASTYSQLKIELIGTGEQSGTWGATTNTNLGTAIEEAITGTVDVPFSNADVTLTLTNSNASQTARNLRLNLTGTVAAAQNLIVPAIEKFYIINNTLTYDITVKNTSGTGTVIKAGTSGLVFNNMTNVVSALNYYAGSAAISGGTINNTTIGATTPSTIKSTDLTVNGNTILGDASGDTVDIKAAAWTLTNSPTVSGTWTNLGNVTTVAINGGTINGTTIGATTASTGKFSTITDTGNLTFTGTANRITGDFSNATFSNRVAFQTSTADSNTVVGVLPNGTATGGAYQVYNNSTPTNAGLASLEASSSAVTLASSIRGSGTYLPMAFNVNGTESLRLLTTGAISFGSSGTGYGTSGQVLTSQGSGAAPTWTTNGAGSVTSITAGTGLSGGTITTSGTISINTAVTVDVSTAQTLTNKRVTTRSLTPASTSGTVTPASDTYDQVNYLLTGTAAFAVPSGTPTDGQKLNIRLYAASTQTVSWTTSSTGYRVIGTTLPTSVASGKTVYVGCVWNSTDSFWDVVAVATQA